MNCAFHPEVESVAFCVSCGSALCESCRRAVEGSVYCENCLGELVRRGMRRQASDPERPPRPAADPQFSPGAGPSQGGPSSDSARVHHGSPSVGGENPGAAFALGLIPGVGAIYNGEFFKAAAHIVIFGFLISLADMGSALSGVFGLLVMGFYFYMPFEAYYTAKKRKLLAEGYDLETPIDRFHQQFGEVENKELWGGLGLVLLGLIFLADSFLVFPMRDVLRLWPIILVALGVWLVVRHREEKGPGPGTRSAAPTGPDKSEEERRGA